MAVERIDLDKPLWDLNTFAGRWQHFAWVTDFRTCTTSDQRLLEAKQLCEQYRYIATCIFKHDKIVAIENSVFDTGTLRMHDIQLKEEAHLYEALTIGKFNRQSLKQSICRNIYGLFYIRFRRETFSHMLGTGFEPIVSRHVLARVVRC